MVLRKDEWGRGRVGEWEIGKMRQELEFKVRLLKLDDDLLKLKLDIFYSPTPPLPHSPTPHSSPPPIQLLITNLLV